MSGASTDAPYLLARGRRYGGVVSMRVSRGLDRMCTDAEITLAEQWSGSGGAWQLVPFTPVTIMVGSDPIMTGYIDGVEPVMSPREHRVVIRARSKTEDLVDCMLDISSGQFQGYTLEQISRAVTKPFGIGVIVETNASMIVADATIQRAETVYQFLERLARMSAVLLTDNAQGNLVLTRTGSTKAAGALAYGKNIEAARGQLNVSKRFSNYIVKGQSGIKQTGSVQTMQRAVAIDPGVPRFRPHVSIAESQLSQAGMQQRANWERNYAFGRATLADIDVKGWRQPDGALWVINQMVSVYCPPLQLNADMLIAAVSYQVADHGGTICRLTVGSPEGYTPDPGEVRLRKRHRGHGGMWNLDGLGSAND